MNKFELTSAYQPTGDQPEAIAQLTEGVHEGLPAQTLLGVTGSGKTFTIANVIANINKPTLILSHNKTLAAQLYSEFKGFFPNNAVEYYVSYYDYYQPEAYLPSSDTYIEKDLAINDEIDKLRLAATSALLSGRKDVVVVSSVSCIYGMGNPADFYNNVIEVQQGKNFSRNVFLRRLVDSLYVRNDIDLNRGNFRVKGDTVDIYLAYADNLLRVTFWGDEVDSIEEVDPMSGVTVAKFDAYKIYPANLFMTTDLGIDTTVAGSVVGTYWFLMLIGRFAGGLLGAKVSPKAMLSTVATAACLLVICAMLCPVSAVVSMPVFQSDISFGMAQVPVSIMLLVLCGLCTSVMWGGIFNLAVEGLGKYTSAASGIFMVMVCGGGILPLIQGLVADHAGYMMSFWVVFAGVLYILYYALAGHRNVNTDIKVD